ncbi:MAG: SMC family ATPase [Thermoleophilia bacterium]
MRPLALSMQAFGPYKTTETIDFAELGGNKLFLIHGETGAGKTSILDAIVFALYGDTSGGERQASQMRCESAAPALPTEVVFDFALGARTFRIVRRPKQENAAQRGSGMVQKQAYAAMWETTDAESGSEGDLLASKITEVAEQVHDRLGFSSDQFRQVVVLPQGKFRDLLAAGSDKREEIMRQLFRTEECAELERRLQERAREVVRQREELLSERRIRLSTVEAEDDESLAALTKQALQRVEDAKRASLAADNAAAEAAKALSEARSADEAATAARKAEEELGRLTGRKAALDALREKAAWARKAEKVAPFVGAADEAAEALKLAEVERAEAQEALKTAGAAQKKAAAALRLEEKREPQRTKATERVRSLGELQRKVAEWLIAERDSAEAQCHLDGATVKFQEARDGLNTAKAALEAATLEGQKIAAACQKLSTARLELERADEAAQACAARDAAKEELTRLGGLTAKAKACRDAAQKAFEIEKAAHDDLDVQWRAGRAGALAGDLKPGSPCPVCGSLEHPAPAHGAEQISDEALDEARAGVEDARSSLETAKGRLADAEKAEARANERLTTLKGAVKAGLATAKAQAALHKRRIEVNELEDTLRDAPDPDEIQADAREAVDLAEKELQAAQEAERTASSTAANKKGHADQLVCDIPADLRNEESVSQALHDAREILEKLETAYAGAHEAKVEADSKKVVAERDLNAAERALKSGASKYDSSQKALERALTRQAFSDLAACRVASMPEDEIAAAEEHVEAHNTALDTAKGRLEQARSVLKKHPKVGDLDEYARSADATAEAAREAQTFLSETEGRLRGFENVHEELAKLDERFADAAARFAVIGRLDEVANGRSEAAKVSFQRWVLGAYLDDVLAAASRRLFDMSRGRFRLERQREITDRRRATGLELAVYDSYSNRSRPAVTLSGGESFQAALSLALGLAETVQERSGGTRLETIFVDEGFGALDPDSLDLAVEALMELKDSGRLVGVITHVPEMRQVIDARLEVRGGPAGSSTEFVVA